MDPALESVVCCKPAAIASKISVFIRVVYLLVMVLLRGTGLLDKTMLARVTVV